MAEHELQDGQVWFWTDQPDAKDPQPHLVHCTLHIGEDGLARLTQFRMDPVKDIETEVGLMTMDVRMPQDGTGHFDRNTRQLHVQCSLNCRLKRGLVRVDGDLPLTLSTGSVVKPNGDPLPGQPVDAQGMLTVVAAAEFVSGNPKLNGVRCGVKITGRLAPPPA